MRNLPTTTLAGLVLLGSVGCDASPPPPAASLSGDARSSPAVGGAAGSTSTDLVHHLHRSLPKLAELEHAVIWGELAVARERAATLLHAPRVPSPPRGWDEPLSALSAAARELTQASSLAATASAVANLAAACGGCHQAHGGPPEPLDADAPDRRSLRASWAIARMSDGLVTPSPRAWEGGLAALDDPPVCRTTELPPRPEHCMSLGEFSRHAARAQTLQRRTRVYAALLTTCGTCHISKPR